MVTIACVNAVHRVHHYVIRRQDDSRVHLEGSTKTFIGPVELITYHRKKKAGLVTRLTSACPRPPQMPGPYFWFGVTIDEFNDACYCEVRHALLLVSRCLSVRPRPVCTHATAFNCLFHFAGLM